jgi:hypothetical protein
VTEREELLVHAVTDRLRALAASLIEAGWRPEVIVFAPSEIERIPGYKVALVVPVESTTDVERAV